MSVFIALLVISITLLIVYLKYLHTYWRRRGLPHNKPHFPLGNMKDWRKTKHFTELLDPVYERYKGTGPFAGFYFMFRPAVIALDLEFIKNVLIRDFSNFDERGIFHNERDDPLTGNLFQVNGEKWRPLRQKLTPTFTSGKMRNMFHMVQQVGDELTAVMSEKSKADMSGELEITDLLGRFTADVIGTCAFGLECNSLRNPQAEFCVMGRRVFVERRHNKWLDGFLEGFPRLAATLRMRQIHPDCHDFYMRIVRDTVNYREQHKIRRNDFMDMLIDVKNSPQDHITLNELTAQAFAFFVAGFETSSTTMGFALYELAHHPQIQQRLRDEINSVLKRHNNTFSYECMSEMHYMEQVIAETLRKYPVLAHLVRIAKERYETADPRYYIEPGTMIMVAVSAIHHDPQYYPEPQIFDPERFSEQEIRKRPSCAYIPFGEGPRNCIGARFGKMQTAIGLFNLVKNFQFSVCDRTQSSMSYIKQSPLLSPEGGIYLRVERLQQH